mmetsp:Transcript_17804/g.32842  ORF Transcript_17804/g.32842 Transcript_17804/m.32842 type:complete len:267 (+) Transcript_17804:76-876(+)
MSMREAVKLARSANGFATLRLCRPDKHNAMSDAVIGRIREVLAEAKELKPRALFVRAEGRSFSAGADLEWMKRAATYTREENTKDAMELGTMLKELATFPSPTVALVQGAALGGGVGLVAACDIAVGVKKASFTLSEVKLGLIPATISPYVVRRIGSNQCRRYFLTAERMSADEARRIGLLHEVVEEESGLDSFEEHFQEHFARNGPGAMEASKSLIEAVESQPCLNDELILETAQRLAAQRDTDECREGIGAFFEKRAPAFNTGA